MGPGMDALTLVLPAWNERDVIVPVVEEALAAPELDGMGILLVDDGSTDGTGGLLDDLAARHSRCGAMHLPHGGKDAALWAAFARVETEWVGIMDSDGQYDPRDAAKMLAMGGEGYAAIWGVRAKRHDNGWRKAISKAGRLAKRAVLGSCTVKDTGCGLWIAKTDMVRDLAELCPRPAGQVHCHIPELIRARGGKIGETPVAHRSRLGGHAKFGALNRLVPGFASLLQARRALRGARHAT